MLNKNQTIASAKVEGDNNIIIQNSDHTEIRVHLDNPLEVKQALVNMQNQLQEIPAEILKLMEEKSKNVQIEQGAHIYLSLNYLFEQSIVGNGVLGMSLGITITNTTKENRWFNQPFFKLTESIDGADTFSLLSANNNNPPFPHKLEYGEPISAYYNIESNQINFFKQVLMINPDAEFYAISNTTLGEIYSSNKYKISKLVNLYNQITHTK